MGEWKRDTERDSRGEERKRDERGEKREGKTQGGWRNGWSRLATPIPNTKAKRKMADANRARSARVTALNSAYARYTPSSRLFSAYLVANNPSAASTRHSANILDHRPSPVPSFPSSSFDPSIPGGRVHPRSIVRRAGQSAPKSAQFHHNIPCTVRFYYVGDRIVTIWQWTVFSLSENSKWLLVQWPH